MTIKRSILLLLLLLLIVGILSIGGAVKLAHGQTNFKLTHTRLYIPISSYTTILKDNNDYSLLSKDYLASTRSIVTNNQPPTTNNYYPLLSLRFHSTI